MSKEKYTKEVIEEALSASDSLSEALRKMGANPSGNTRNHIKRKISEYGLSTQHFTYGNQGKPAQRKKIEEILVYNESKVRTKSTLLKRAMLDSGLNYKCSAENCGLEDGLTWAGKILTLDIDHVDGDYRNNKINNLRFLCPNCHRLTETYGYKGKPKNTCLDCGNEISRHSKRCVKCSNVFKAKTEISSKEKHNYPETEELVKGIEKFGYVKYAASINLSDNGLRKLLKRRNMKVLPKKTTWK